MKFKSIVIIFNIIILFLLSAVTVLPGLFFGSSMAVMFLETAWPLAVVLGISFAALNIFFLVNCRLFMLLEREDWPALAHYLETHNRGYRSSRRVRLLINSCLVMNDLAGILRLENRIAVARPALLEANALIFGAVRILGGDAPGAVRFFQIRLEKSQGKRSGWIRWYYAFSLLLEKSFEKAEAEFGRLISISTDVLITGLSAFFLSQVLPQYSFNQAECRKRAGEGRERVKKALKDREKWKKEAAKVETEVYIAIIKKYMEEAGVWLFDA
ncbi:MAG: hypothetical protein LBD48_05850 [Treponema sp.]|nr:hypothetical protein [Treponema sp.]